MNLLFAIKALSLAGGGAERVLADVSAALVERGHRVTIITFDRPGDNDFYAIHPRVERMRLGIGALSSPSRGREVVARITALRRAARSLAPDVAIGFMLSAYFPLGLALAGTNIPVVASEHTDVAHWRRNPLQGAALRASASLYAALTVVSDAIKAGYWPAIARRMLAIGNPVSAPTGGVVRPDEGRKIILSVGRLSIEKDHETLIKAFANLVERHPDWDLRIVGEGVLRPNLERLVAELNLRARVALPGATAEIEDEFQRADLYVHPAVYESFGLATAEALTHGVPAVGFADCPGTNELIVDGQNGVLVKGTVRVAALAEALDKLLSSGDIRAALAARAQASMESFSIGRVADAWEDLLGRVASGKRTPLTKDE